MAEIISLNIKNKHLPAADTSLIGRTGEELAARFLKRNGYDLVLSNFKVPIGRTSRGVQVSGEIDIIALERGYVVFYRS